MAQRALELVLGSENIRAPVELVVESGEGHEVAESVLVHINSAQASHLAYEIFRASEGQRASDAAALVKQIAHPTALAYVEEFLAHPSACGWGIAVLDQLLWRDRADPEDAEVARLLELAEAHESEHVREHAARVRDDLRSRSSGP